MKYKVGDRVKIKSLDWYNENSDDDYNVVFADGWRFSEPMSIFCGKELIIERISHTTNLPHYMMKDNAFGWTDEMIEGLVEEETKPKHEDEVNGTEEKIWIYQMGQIIHCPEGYIFKDENGNVINAQKIVLEKVNTLKIQSDNMETETHRGHCTTEPETTSEGKKRGVVYFWDNDFADKVELDLSDRELIQEDGKWFVVKKKKGYPKTYEECYKIMGVKLSDCYIQGYKSPLLEDLQELLICRDAYWMIYGEENGLGKPWEPTMETVYCISRNNNVMKCSYRGGKSNILEFPTAEMRDAFYENFKELIESCKELL